MENNRGLDGSKRGRRIAFGASLLLVVIALVAYVWAGTVNSTATSASISADTAATGGTGAWTTLSGPTYAETINGDLNNGTVTLTAPAGFEFNPNAVVFVELTSGDSQAFKNMNDATVGGNVASTSSGTVTLTSSTVTFSIFSKSQGSTLNTIVWHGIQVRPTKGYPLASGNITASGTSGIAIVANSTNFGTLTEVPGAMKKLLTVLPNQAFTAGTGVTGTPPSQTAGTTFNLSKLVAVDQFNNIVTTYTGTKTITYTGPSANCGVTPSYTTNVSFTSGQSTTTLVTTLKKAETTAITANDGSLATGTASSSFAVNAAPLSQLVVTLPGQTFSACTGNTGTPTNQTAGTAFNITSITATDAYFNVIAGYSGNKTLSYSGPGSGAAYTTSVSFSNGQSTTSLVTVLQVAETTSLTVSDGALSGPPSSAFTVVGPVVGSFNAFETGTAPAATAVAGVIKTKISGTAFGLDIVAIASGATPSVATTFSGTVKVELVDNSSGAACGSAPNIQTLPNQTFTSAEKGRHTIASITEQKAWKDVKLRISYPATSPPSIVSCSNDNFAIRPATLSNVTVTDQVASLPRTLDNTSLTGGNVQKAGQTFTIKATAKSSGGNILTEYSGSPVAVISQCSVAGGVCPASLGTLNPGTWSSGAGVVTTATATYSEVGAFSMVLQDADFAIVDKNDSTDAERIITSSPVTVGRFVPDHFTVSAGSVTPRSDIPACATSLFSYMNEPFGISFTLSAQNASNGVTSNYAGALATLDMANPGHLNVGAIDIAAPTPLVAPISAITRANPGNVTTSVPHKLSTGTQVYISGVNGMTGVNNALYTVTVLDATHFTIGVDTSGYGTYAFGGNASRLSVSSSSGTWTAGVVNAAATLLLQRAAAPDGAFNAVKIGIAPQDPDNVQASTFDLDADNNATAERVTIGLTQFRFGRMALKNAYGSELLNLPISVQAQYWNGSGFVANDQDSCTSIKSASNVQLANHVGGINAANMASPGNVLLGSAFSAGIGNFILKKPVPQPAAKGSIDITLDLAAEGKTYLQGKWSGTSYNQNPTSRAAFGVYKGGAFIYQREVY